MPAPRIKVETFQAVTGPKGRGLAVARGLQLVKELSDQGYINPAIHADEPNFGPLDQRHRKLRMDWPASSRRKEPIEIDAFNINPNVLDHPEMARRYKITPSLAEEVGQAALVSIVSYANTLFEGQAEANKDRRRIDLFKAGRRAGDPYVDVVFLKENEECFVVVGDETDPFALTSLLYLPNNPDGLDISQFGPVYRGPWPELHNLPTKPDEPSSGEGGSGVREPRRPGPRAGAGGAAEAIPQELITEARSELSI